MSSLLVLPQAQFFPVSCNLDRRLLSTKSSDIFRYGHFSKSLRYDDQLVHPEFTPKHVAIIMDGHRRWAKARGLPVQEGHKFITPNLKNICNVSTKLGIQVITAFAFSTENWNRSKYTTSFAPIYEEVDFLMKLFEQFFEEFMRTSSYDALNYGGKYDILQATKSIASKVKDGLINLEDINNKLFEQELATKCAKTPDLVIRTGGEQRLSNFLLWELAYSELYFTKTLFPDFGEEPFKEAILSFQQRHRRFGGHTY
ncbi:hypothetical protein H5410_032503 [Solanum commersonii]|uniref:Alkyl transferase n=1 Tax=Solanum commersonii TaxID=4109 RepID=A0A9J5YMD8_SOLCO|nr:hypothetical protein H5410_032503 [Solanum commersonii]